MPLGACHKTRPTTQSHSLAAPVRYHRDDLDTPKPQRRALFGVELGGGHEISSPARSDIYPERGWGMHESGLPGTWNTVVWNNKVTFSLTQPCCLSFCHQPGLQVPSRLAKQGCDRGDGSRATTCKFGGSCSYLPWFIATSLRILMTVMARCKTNVFASKKEIFAVSWTTAMRMCFISEILFSIFLWLKAIKYTILRISLAQSHKINEVYISFLKENYLPWTNHYYLIETFASVCFCAQQGLGKS